MTQGPKLSRRRRKQLQDAARGQEREIERQLEALTSDQRALLLQLQAMNDQGNGRASTKEIADALGWEPRFTVGVLRQLRALGLIAHDLDGGGKQPDPELVEQLRKYGLWGGLDEATPEELDALVLIEQGADRLPAPERAGFLIGCGLQELREQGHTPAAIRKLVNEYLDAGDEEWAADEKTKGAAN